MTVSLPPDINLSFKCIRVPTEEEMQNFLSEVENNRMASLILKSLFKASEYSEKIQIGEFKLSTVSIKLGLIPSISINFS